MRMDEWEQALARSIVDLPFRVRLLADPVDTLADYGLHPHEAHVLAGLRARTLAEFAASLLRLRPAKHSTDMDIAAAGGSPFLPPA